MRGAQDMVPLVVRIPWAWYEMRYITSNATVAACHDPSNRWSRVVTIPFTEFSTDGCYRYGWLFRGNNGADGVLPKTPEEATSGATRYGGRRQRSVPTGESEPNQLGVNLEVCGTTTRTSRGPREYANKIRSERNGKEQAWVWSHAVEESPH